MVCFLAPMGASYRVARTAGKWMTETARAIRFLKSPAKIKKITRKSQGNFRVIRLDKMAD